MSKKKIVFLIILILFLLPEFGDDSEYYDNDPYAWRFWNFRYHESKNEEGERICFDVMPQPEYSLSYRGAFVDIRYFHDYCEDWESWHDEAISLFIGIEYWGGEKAVYHPVFWISISDKDINIDLFGESIL